MTYKHISLFILSLSCVSVLLGQQKNYILTTNESGAPKAYVARDSVSMKRGFSYKGTAINKFSAKIDERLLFPPTENTYAKPDGTITTDPALGGVVGSIAGQFNVSPSGGAYYMIPIECPPGINGMQPNISLVYNSQGGNGIAGWGWNIGGMSAICRVPKNQYFDGETTGIIWDANSPLALDGQRLIQVQKWSTDSVEYKTECDSYNRIVGYQLLSWGPTYFKVYTKSGQTIQYGNTTELASYFPLAIVGSLTLNNIHNNLQWGICSVSDNNGNFIKYTYKYNSNKLLNYNLWDPKDILLDKVSYGGNSIVNSTAGIEVCFDYINRTDTTGKYIDGFFVEDTKALSSIRVVNNGQTISKDSVSYNYYDNKMHLKAVNRSKNGTKLNPTTFEWSANDYSFSYQGNVTYEQSNLLKKYQDTLSFNNNIWIGRTFGDIDGDGDQDVVLRITLEKKTKNDYNWLPYVDDYYYTYKNIWVLYRNDNGFYKYVYEEDWDKTNENSFIFLDRDNDGACELYKGNEDRSILRDNFYSYYCYKYIISSKTVEHWGSKRLDFTSYNNQGGKSVYMSDFIGNGESQFMFFYKNDDGVFCPLDYETDDCVNIEVGDIPSSKYVNLYITDINGNGKSEIMYATRSGISFYEVNKEKLATRSGFIYPFRKLYENTDLGISSRDEIYPADFNGDGNTDFLVKKYSTQIWEFYISTGTSLVKKIMSNSLKTTSTIQILDANKDGKSDILFFDLYTSQSQLFKLLVSNGRNFEEKFSKEISGCLAGFKALGRINSDKYDDILLSQCFNFDDPYYKLSNNIIFDKIVKIQDAYQNITSTEYDRFNSNQIKKYENSLSSEGQSGNQPEEQISVSTYGNWDVVKAVKTQSTGNNYLGSLKYEYNSAIIHKKGKGMLGFLNTSVTDLINSTVNTSCNKIDTTHFFLYPYSTVSKLTSNSVISENYSEYSIQTVGLGYNMNLSKQTSNDVLNGLSSVTDYSSYDSWGNPQTVKTTTGELTETKTIVYDKNGSWCSNKPKSVTTTRQLGTDVNTRVLEYVYNTKGNLTKETIDPSDPNKLITEYKDFDDFGHARTVEVTANDSIRRSSMTYTSSGRFVQSKTTALGETSIYDWDETKNQLKTEANRLGTTSYTYYGFGQLAETKYPDGIRKTNVLQWASPGNALGAKYYTYSEISGSAPVYTWYDALGREVTKEAFGLDGKKISVFTNYISNGKVNSISEPTFNTTPSIWAKTYSYDEYGRPKTVTTPMGTITTNYAIRNTTVTSPEGISVKKLNTSGLVDRNEQNGKGVTYTYYASGLPKTTTPDGGQPLSMEYDLQGNRTKLNDPDGGIIETKFNGFGEMIKTVQEIKKGEFITTTNTYNMATGELKNINRNDENTVYSYDSKHRVSKIEIADKHKQSFTYGDFDRVKQFTETIDSKAFTTQTEYDAFGREKKHVYPSGYFVTNTYDIYGNLTEVKDKLNHSIWKPLEENARGQLTKISRGGRETTFGFDNRGLPNSILSNNVLNLKYFFDSKGNLKSRTDVHGLTNQKDSLSYDTHNRLTNWDVYQSNTLAKLNSITYDEVTGNITKKSDLDNLTMNYGENGKPHALTSISGKPTAIPLDSLNVTYTDFKKIATINEGSKLYTLSYGVDDQRCKSIYRVGNALKQTRYYLGDYEEEVNAAGNIRKIHYLSDGAIFIQNNGKDTLLYGYSDYQGSLTAMIGDSGIVIERYAYDPWGQRRNPENWTQVDSRTSWRLNRGYTGHEHLDAFSIINMNGRVYDPLTGMFFSPDPYVQAPDSWLNFNRYGYCYGNPFKYTDPSGEFIFAAIFVGAIIGGFVGGMQADMKGGEYWSGFWKGAVIGGLAGAGGAFIGQSVAGALGTASSLGGSIFNGAITGASGGFVGGFIGGAGNSWMNGSDLGQGLQSGFRGGLYGALGGALIGGATGGLQYQKQMTIFGKGCNELGVDGGPVPATDDFLNRAQKAWYKDAPMDKINKFTVDAGNTFTGDDGKGAFGATRALSEFGTGKLTGSSNVYFNREVAFSSAKRLFFSMGHELVHVSQFASLAGQQSSLLQQSFIYNDEIFNFGNLMDYHAYSYQNAIGGTTLNAFPRGLVNALQTQFPSYFNSMNYTNFGWTNTASYTNPF